jgi:hypothetical protein
MSRRPKNSGGSIAGTVSIILSVPHSHILDKDGMSRIMFQPGHYAFLPDRLVPRHLFRYGLGEEHDQRT